MAYTVKSYTDSVNKEQRSRIVSVIFTDGVKDIPQDFRFSVGETVDNIKRVVKQFLTELNSDVAVLSGDITDYTAPVEPVPTQTELNFQAWVKDRADLKKLKELVVEGVVPANTTQQTNLQNKVNTGWKNTYFNLI